MTIAYWCVLAAAIMPYVFAGLAKSGGKPYNNQAPRKYLEGQEGWRKRANWAQLNAFEAFPAFAAGVIIAHQLDAGQGTVNGLAVGFIACRIAYGFAYVLDWATLRSLVWTGGFACVVALFVAAA